MIKYILFSQKFIIFNLSTATTNNNKGQNKMKKYRLRKNVNGTYEVTSLRYTVKFTGTEAECREWLREKKEAYDKKQQAKFDAFEGDIVTPESLNEIMKATKSWHWMKYNGVIKCKWTL